MGPAAPFRTSSRASSLAYSSVDVRDLSCQPMVEPPPWTNHMATQSGVATSLTHSHPSPRTGAGEGAGGALHLVCRHMQACEHANTCTPLPTLTITATNAWGCGRRLVCHPRSSACFVCVVPCSWRYMAWMESRRVACSCVWTTATGSRNAPHFCVVRGPKRPAREPQQVCPLVEAVNGWDEPSTVTGTHHRWPLASDYAARGGRATLRPPSVSREREGGPRQRCRSPKQPSVLQQHRAEPRAPPPFRHPGSCGRLVAHRAAAAFRSSARSARAWNAAARRRPVWTCPTLTLSRSSRSAAGRGCENTCEAPRRWGRRGGREGQPKVKTTVDDPLFLAGRPGRSLPQTCPRRGGSPHEHNTTDRRSRRPLAGRRSVQAASRRVAVLTAPFRQGGFRLCT
eukprot:359545-Chlamydomonas_euryale.AAC.3